MDLNELFHRQQVEHMRADAAACVPSRRAHQGLAFLYEERIEAARAARPDER